MYVAAYNKYVQTRCEVVSRQSAETVSWDGVRLSPLGTSATNWPIVPAPDDNDKSGAVGGMRIGRGNRRTRRKPAPKLLCPPQVPHDLTWSLTRVARMGSRRLTAELWHGLEPIVTGVFLTKSLHNPALKPTIFRTGTPSDMMGNFS
jgi:hypothetical protein